MTHTTPAGQGVKESAAAGHAASSDAKASGIQSNHSEVVKGKFTKLYNYKYFGDCNLFVNILVCFYKYI